MAQLSQDELARLSVALVTEGILDHSFTQSAIARWEKDPADGANARRRVAKLREETIDTLAILFEQALIRAGYEGADRQELAKHLHTANNRRVDPRQVSRFALEMDALMSPWPRWLREMAQDTIRQTLQGMNRVYERYRSRKEGDSTSE